MRCFLFIAACLVLHSFVAGQDVKKLSVNFDFDKARLTTSTRVKLDSFFAGINKSGITAIYLSGHCDSKGSDLYNDALSLERVDSVKNYLVNNNAIPASVITTNAFGEKKLLNSDVTEYEGFLNRRVEIEVSIQQAVQVEEKKEVKTLADIVKDTATKVGTTITLPDLNFENNSDRLIPSSIPTLKELLDILEKNPILKISIEGHICCVQMVKGVPYDRLPNYQISVMRAKMVYDYLLNNGIGADRVLGYKGFGSSRPVFPIPERTEEERTANRRVEIRIVEK